MMNLSDLSLNDISRDQLIECFDLLPDILFWIKNTKGQFLYANKFFLEHIGMTDMEQIIGRTDYDFSPRHIAKQFIEDDKRVAEGMAVTDRLEVNLVDEKSATLSWFTTSKRPLYDQQGNVIGSYGTSRQLDKTSVALSGMEALKKPIRFIRKNFMHDITMPELADISCLSISALERRFKKFLLKTPKQYITDVRLENARKLLLETQMHVSAIAHESGFPDPSYFSRTFKKQFGVLPTQFRLINKSE